MQINPVGYLGYELYSLGWQNAIHKNLDPIKHLMFTALLYYRRGFAEGSAFVRANSLEGIVD